jgi:hypothetical protein
MLARQQAVPARSTGSAKAPAARSTASGNSPRPGQSLEGTHLMYATPAAPSTPSPLPAARGRSGQGGTPRAAAQDTVSISAEAVQMLQGQATTPARTDATYPTYQALGDRYRQMGGSRSG